VTASQPSPPAPCRASYEQGSFLLSADATEILLVRHGQSVPYVDGVPFPLTGGHGDPPLSERGHEQARRLGARLSTAGLAAIYVTTLQRTAQTAAPLAARLGLAPRVVAALREVHLGEWEGGLYRKMVAEQHPIAQLIAAQERWDVVPGAEPAAAFADRVRSGIDQLAAAHPGQRVAAVTHGGVIGQALALASGSRPFAFTGADNASVSRLVVAEGRWIVRGFNDTAHLDRPGDLSGDNGWHDFTGQLARPPGASGGRGGADRARRGGVVAAVELPFSPGGGTPPRCRLLQRR